MVEIEYKLITSNISIFVFNNISVLSGGSTPLVC